MGSDAERDPRVLSGHPYLLTPNMVFHEICRILVGIAPEVKALVPHVVYIDIDWFRASADPEGFYFCFQFEGIQTVSGPLDVSALKLSLDDFSQRYCEPIAHAWLDAYRKQHAAPRP